MAYQQNLKGENGKNASFSALLARFFSASWNFDEDLWNASLLSTQEKNEKESHSTTASVWLEVPGEEEDVSYIFLQC